MAIDADTTEIELGDTEASARTAESGGSSPAVAADDNPADRSLSHDPARPKVFQLPVVQALIAGLAMTLALTCLVGWLAYRAHETHMADKQRQEFIQAGRTAAIDLTTIDHSQVDADVRRILDFATGEFHDDFQKRSPAFIDAITKNQSRTVGTVAEAGLESVQSDGAQVLVAVSVKTSTIADPDQPPKAWRMRINVRKVDNQMKISDVKFVP